MPVQSLLKKSARTVRKPCKFCHEIGTRYWFEDAETGKFVAIEAGPMTRDMAVGDRLVINEGNERTHLHKFHCTALRAAEPYRPVEPSSDVPVVTDAPSPAPIIEGPSVEQDPPQDKLAAINALLDLLGQSAPLDEDAVRAIVRDVLAEQDRPVRTVVIQDTITREVAGLSHKALPEVMTALSTGIPTLMVGPAGTGKSTIARQAAEGLGVDYFDIPLDPGMTASQMFGYMNASGEYVRTPFRDWFEKGNAVFHADELDNGHPSVVAKLNAALALGEGQTMAFPDGMIAKGENARFVASANTFGTGPDRVYVGRNQLDGATLDRFLTIEVDYDESLERNACLSTGVDTVKLDSILGTVRNLRQRASDEKLPLIFGQRSSVYGCKLAQAGVSSDRIMAMAIRRSVSDRDWNRLGAPSLAF